MAQIISGPFTGIIIVVIAVVASISYRIYIMRRPGAMRAKCPKCGNIFDASRSFSVIHIGSLKQLKCPACGKTSFMHTGTKDSITWPSNSGKQAPQPEPQLTEEELEKKRIEESKYEKP